MFEVSGIDKQSLHDALRKMGKKNIKNALMRKEWSDENPTRNYCYVVSEMLYWYVAPEGTKPYSLEIPGDLGLHRFLKYPGGEIIDLTCDQFKNGQVIDYSKAKVRYFLQTGCKGPSKRAKMLAELLGFTKIKEYHGII